ncbi:MAG: hypothetical protein OXD50_12560 [Chloroflexi bacterium]|nr:hypothetical protein [Chloroflexota bacterium]
MRSILFDGTARRWSLGVALVAGLATLLITLAPSLDAQSQPLPPQYFWGTDATNYAGAEVKVFDQNGNELPACPVSAQCEQEGIVYSDGGWHVAVDPREATKVKLRIVSAAESRETNLLDVVGGDGQGVSIRQFVNVVQVETAPTETLPIRITVRLHPTRPLRTLEFNISVNNIRVSPAPPKRYLTPGLRTDRWLQSSVIDAGNGYQVRIIACKQTDDDVLFGVRVAGHDDIIPRLHRLRSSVTDNEWKNSNVFEIQLPGSSQNVVRLGADADCSGSPIKQ